MLLKSSEYLYYQDLGLLAYCRYRYPYVVINTSYIPNSHTSKRLWNNNQFILLFDSLEDPEYMKQSSNHIWNIQKIEINQVSSLMLNDKHWTPCHAARHDAQRQQPLVIVQCLHNPSAGSDHYAVTLRQHCTTMHLHSGNRHTWQPPWL